MVALDYDMKEFLRIIYNTKAFQREAPKRQISARDTKDETLPHEVKWVIDGPYPDNPKRNAAPYFYQGPVMERMSGEQLWDSLVSINYPDLDSRINSGFPEGGFDRYDKFSQMTPEELFADVMGMAPPGSENSSMMAANNESKPINENCPIRTGRKADPSITAKNEKGETVAFCCNGCKDQFLDSMPAMDVMKEESNMMMADSGGGAPATGYRRRGTATRDTNSLRASEVGNPAPNGHLIRQFGGSPRDQIQVSHKQAAVNQVLALMNGFAESQIIQRRDSKLMKTISEQSNMDKKIEIAFQALLQRKPQSNEMRDFKEALKLMKSEDYEKDIAWVLLNSHEFLFVP